MVKWSEGGGGIRKREGVVEMKQEGGNKGDQESEGEG